MKIGFALIPNEKTVKKIIDVENRIHEKAGFINILGEKINRPHITLFQGEFKNNFNYINAANEIVKYMNNSSEENNKIEFTTPTYYSKGWYFLMCKKTQFMQELHNFTLQLCSNDVEKDMLNKENEELTKAQIESLKNYGYKYADKAYAPHVTIGRNFNIKENKKLLQKLKEEFKDLPTSSTFTSITVYEMGENGTHAKTLYEIKL